ncbi:hypothetical protein TYRP_018552 [Tyrophagus putrescentiae]|nr:hypothetical protein TYRP_018552 [Tyrophagus putrescentiae]
MTKSSKNSLSKSTISASKTVSGFSKKSAKHSEQPSASASVIGASAQHSAKSTKSGRPKLCKEMAKVIGTRGATELQSAKELKTRHYELKEAVPDQDGLKRATGPKGKKMICKMIELKYCTPRYKVTMECYSLKIMRFIGRRPLLSSFPQVYDIFLAEKVYYIFMSDCGCKSLYDVVLSGEHLSPGRIRGWIRSLIEAVCEMQKYGIAHRFIKLKHILIEQNSSSSDNHSPHSLKIVGWSKSVLFYDAKRKKALYQHRERRARKNNFLPPEAFHRLYDPSKADVWAVGVILISLTTGRYPFHVRAHLKFSAQWRRFVRQHPLNPIVRSLANRIFVIDSKRRIHAREALKHSYFSVEERQLVNRSVRGKPLKEQQQQHSAAPPSASAASKSPKTHSALVKSKSSSFASHAKSAVAKSRTYSSSPVRPSSAVKSAKSSSVPAGSLSGPKSDHTAASSSPSKSLSKSGYSSGSTLTNDKNGSRTSKLSKASIGASMKGSTSKSSKSSTSSKKATSKIKSKSGKRKSAKHKKSEKKKPKSSKPSKPKSKPVAEKSAKSVKATSKSEKDKHSKSKSSTSKSKKSKSTTASKPTSAKPKSLVVKSSKAAKSEISSKSTKEKVKSATADSDSKKAKTEKTSASDASAKGDDKEEKVAEGKDNHSNLDGGVSKQEMEAEADDAQAESDQAKEEEAEPEMDEVAKEEMEKEEGKDGEGKVAPDGERRRGGSG